MMIGERRRSREIALQVLFQSEFTPSLSADQAFHLYSEHFENSDEIREFALELIQGIWKSKSDLDVLISNHTSSWTVKRMTFVDKNILRIAAFELKYLGDKIPPKVAMNEAIEIGKRFGSKDSSSFINGVLDNIQKTLKQ
jgi:transcription antitermination protein NusB